MRVGARRAVRAQVVVVTTTGLLLGSVGCGTRTEVAPSALPVSVADLAEPATEDVVLQVRGGASNSDDGLRLSREQIERLGTREITVYEPFVAEDVTFTVVPWSSVLELADLPDDVETLHTVAYNEYEVDIPTDVADEPGVWLATRQDGEPIEVADGGPTRVVFDDTHPDAGNESLWIWSIALVEPS